MKCWPKNMSFLSISILIGIKKNQRLCCMMDTLLHDKPEQKKKKTESLFDIRQKIISFFDAFHFRRHRALAIMIIMILLSVVDFFSLLAVYSRPQKEPFVFRINIFLLPQRLFLRHMKSENSMLLNSFKAAFYHQSANDTLHRERRKKHIHTHRERTNRSQEKQRKTYIGQNARELTSPVYAIYLRLNESNTSNER